MRPPQKDFDVKPNFGTLLDKFKQLPLRRFADMIAGKLDDLVEMVEEPTPYDQAPGRTVPYCITTWFGPFGLTTARRADVEDGVAGHEHLAALATPDKYLVPNDGDYQISRDCSVRVQSLNAFGFVNWGYKSNPGFDVPRIVEGGVGDILDNVITANGGAMPLDFFGGTFSTISTDQPNLPNIAFEVELYDKRRGRRLHDKRLPCEMFSGGRFANRAVGSPIVLEQGTRFEPRLFVNEFRMGSVLDTDTAFNAASVKGWVALVFKGVEQIEVPNL